MLISFTVAIIILCIAVGIIILKRDALSRLLSSNHEVIRTRSHFQQELEKTAEQVIMQLEDKIFHLEYLLQEADKKMALLDERVALAEKAYADLKEIPLQSATCQVNLNPNSNYSMSSEQEKKAAIDKVNVNQKQTDKRSLVLEMAAQGYSATEISKTTGIGKGEILLLLQLSKR